MLPKSVLMELYECITADEYITNKVIIQSKEYIINQMKSGTGAYRIIILGSENLILKEENESTLETLPRYLKKKILKGSKVMSIFSTSQNRYIAIIVNGKYKRL